ncbi:hypothetical protein I7V28_02990 [Lelliottia amnigena]|uniref:hypothetical protein n=1 Tax=Lelliottia amnigena TaxID=61646 RepID=UPI00192A9AF4|nr:hypothetical protein [Lelliottia amnigena]MBL5920097.1 hypothetical protein [Lelliottia amnigena]
MSESGSDTNSNDIFAKIKIKASNMFEERFSDGFYGYIISSFILFNLENIILIFKSKNPIEMTLIYISVQKHAVLYYYILPLFAGVIASFIFPFLTAIYAKLVSKSKATIKYSKDEAEVERRNKIAVKAISAQKKEDELHNAAIKIRDKKEEINIIQTQIDTRLEQKMNLDNYLKKLADVYKLTAKIENEIHLKTFLSELKRNELLEKFPDTNLVLNMVNGVTTEDDSNKKI